MSFNFQNPFFEIVFKSFFFRSLFSQGVILHSVNILVTLSSEIGKVVLICFVIEVCILFVRIVNPFFFVVVNLVNEELFLTLFDPLVNRIVVLLIFQGLTVHKISVKKRLFWTSIDFCSIKVTNLIRPFVVRLIDTSVCSNRVSKILRGGTRRPLKRIGNSLPTGTLFPVNNHANILLRIEVFALFVKTGIFLNDFIDIARWLNFRVFLRAKFIFSKLKCLLS